MYLASRRQFDAHQLFDRMMPGHVVGHRRDVVHPVGDGHVLVVVQMLADLLKPGMQIADVRHRFDHTFAIQLQDNPQRGVRRRMLRTEIQRPQIVFLLGEFRVVSGGSGRHGNNRVG